MCVESEEISIGAIGNYYGGLSIKKVDDKYHWSIENWNGDHWEEIPESLYLELIKFSETPQAAIKQ